MKHLTLATAFTLMVYGISIEILSVQGQSYPAHPIQLVIPLVAGSALDVNGRLSAEEFGKALGTQIVPVNKPGASLTLGTDAVAKSKKDGYALAYTNTSAIVYSRVLSPEIAPYDPVKDLEPLGLHCFFRWLWRSSQALPGRLYLTHSKASSYQLNQRVFLFFNVPVFRHVYSPPSLHLL